MANPKRSFKASRTHHWLKFVSGTSLIVFLLMLLVFHVNTVSQTKLEIKKRPVTITQKGTITRTFSLRARAREVIEFEITTPGRIDAKVSWSGTATSLALILNGPGQRGYYARKDGKSPLSLNFSLRQSHVNRGKLWKISVANFSSGTARGKVTIDYPKKAAAIAPAEAPKEALEIRKEKKAIIRWSGKAMRQSKPARKHKPPYLGERVGELKRTKNIQINESTVKVNKRRSISYRPLQILDPQTGRQISPDTTFTLPNGQKMSAKRYYDEVNTLESGFNTLGYSLDVRRDPGLSVKLQETYRSPRAIRQNEERARKITDTHRFRDMAPPADLGTVRQDFRKRIKFNKDRLRRLQRYKPPSQILYSSPGQQARPYSKVVETEDYEYGWKDIFAVYFNGKLEFSGDLSKAEVIGNAAAGAYVFENDVRMLYIGGNLYAPSSGGKMKASLTLYIVGVAHEIVETEEPIPSIPIDQLPEIPSIEIEDSWSDSLDESFSTVFPLGPIPLSVEVGIRARAGIGYGIFLSPLYAQGRFGPYVGADVYARAGIDIIIAEAGVSCTLLLLNDSMVTEGGLGLDADERGVFFGGFFSIYNEFEALSGEVEFYACIYVPAFAWPPWKKKCWYWEIAKWQGLYAKGYIYKPTDIKFYVYEGGPPEEVIDETVEDYVTEGELGGRWTPRTQLSQCESIFAPSLAVFGGKLYIVWKTGASQTISYTSTNLNTLQKEGPKIFPKTQMIPNSFSTIPPSVCVYKDRLYVFHGGWMYPDQSLYYRYMDSSGKWWPRSGSVKIEGSSSPDHPSVAIYNNRLYLFYRKPSKKEISYRYSVRGYTNPAGDGSEILTWTRVWDIPNSAFTDSSPAVSAYKDRLYVFFKERTQGTILYKYMNPLGNWTPEGNPKTASGSRTSHPPGMAVLEDRLYMIHKTRGDNMNYRSASQHYYEKSLIWGKSDKVSGANRTDRGPTVCVLENVIFMFHKKKESQQVYYQWFEIQ